VAAITGLIAKENVVATFGALAACITGVMVDVEASGGDIQAAVTMISGTGISLGGLLAFIAFNMTTIPCFAAVATAKGELTNKKFKWTLLFWVVTSYIVSMMIFLIGTWWWTSIVFAILFVVAILIISFINKNNSIKKVK
jgi:ferrous iron transport protein B